MKRKLLLMAVALLCSVGMWGSQTPTENGVYYIQNVETGLFLSRGASYGTHAVLDYSGLAWRLSGASGSMKLQMYDIYLEGDKSQGMGDNSYTDNGLPISNWTLDGDATSGYTIKTGDTYLTASGNTVGSDVVVDGDGTGNKTWKFLTAEQHAAVLAAKKSTQEAAIATSASYTLGESSLSDFVGNTYLWKTSNVDVARPTSSGVWTFTEKRDQGGANNFGDYGTEIYNMSGSFSKTITGLDNGIYKLTVKAMHRSTHNAPCWTVGSEGFTGHTNAYVEANGYYAQLKDWKSAATYTNSKYTPDNTDEFKTKVEAGSYATDIYTYVSNGNLDIKVSQEGFWYGGWFAFYGVTLTKYTPKTLSEVTESASFTSGNSATADTWYAFTVSSDGYYKITSTDASTISYSQIGTDLALGSFASFDLRANGYNVLKLTNGTYYFKSSATSTITIATLADGDVVTDVFITNPSFEDSDMSSWDLDGVFSRQNGSDLSGKSGDYYAGSSFTNLTKSISQSLTGLPAGNYILKVRAKVAKFNSSSSFHNANVTMGGNSTPVRYEFEDDYTVAYNAAEDNASASINFGGKDDNYGYFYCDNFVLTYYSTLPDVSISDLTSRAMDADVRTALTTASSTYSASKTVANYNALQTAIINARISIAKYGTSADSDWTGLITNPSFETGTPNYYKGWTVIVSSGSSTSDAQHRYQSGGLGDDSGSYRFYIWTSDAGAATIKQTLNYLPAGNYKLSAYMSSEKGDVFTLTAGSTSKKVIAGDGSATLVEVYFTQAVMGNVEISAKHSNAWFSLDNFHLIYNPSLPESLTEVSGKMSSTASTTQTTDVEAYYADRTFENLLTAQASMTAAVNSRVVYNNIATIRSNYATKAGALDDDGQDAYDTAINTASTGAETKYEAGDYETAAQAEEAYHSGYVTAVKAQTTQNTDMTEAIVNPSFESDLSTGWSTGDMGRQNNTAFDKKSGTYYVERWHDAGDKYVKQTLSGFHAGLYTMTATAYASKSTSPKVYVKVGGTENSTPVSDSKDYCVSFNYDGSSTLEIGFSATLESDGWVCVDNFRLTYDGAALPASLDEVTGNMNADLRDAANAAISTYNSSNTIENYSAAQTAIAAAEASREVYVTISGIMTTYQGKANALDAAGQAAYTSAINTATTGAASKYNDGAYITAAEAETAFAADYRTAVKAQVTAGSDMTDAIINPSFETGNISPWTSADGGGVASNDNWSSGKVGTYFVERWQTSASGGLSDGTLTQTLTGMPAGRYTLTANAQNIEQQNADAHGTGYFLTLGSAQTEVTSEILTTVTYDLAEAGDLTIGMKLESCTGNWVSCDNFRLTYGVRENVTVSARAGRYGTTILPFTYNFAADDDFANIKFYSCGSVTGKHLEIEEVATPVANTPYIIKNNGGSDISKEISGYSVSLDDIYTVGYLTGVYTAASIAASDETNSRYVLQTDESGAQAFYKVTSDFTATPYKCYLTVPTALGVKAFSLDIEDAIQNVEVIRSENAEIYNLAGQKMNKLQKGVNIVNGKKVLVK